MILDDSYFEENPFSWKKEKKERKLLKLLNGLNKHHYANCNSYKNIIDALDFRLHNSAKLEKLPFLPVNIFKSINLKSVSEKKVLRTMQSSGTTSSTKTKIYLDKDNAILQSKVLSKIVSDFIGKKRLPMLVVDNKFSLTGANGFSAKTAAIRGFSIFAKSMTFALDSKNKLDEKKIINFYKKYKNENIIIFGFTYLVYKKLLCTLRKYNLNIRFPKGLLLHGGGWKKMEDEKIDNENFKREVMEVLNIKKVHNYYGLIEQTGTIYMECEKGFFHASNFSDIYIRKAVNTPPVNNQKGMVQLISPLATSYPGHNILTEDIGMIYGQDNCECGRKGKYFQIFGRLKNTEIRGCSDTIID